MDEKKDIEERIKLCYKYFGMDVEIGLREDSYMGGAVLMNVDNFCPYEEYDCPAQYFREGKCLCSRIFKENEEEAEK